MASDGDWSICIRCQKTECANTCNYCGDCLSDPSQKYCNNLCKQYFKELEQEAGN